MEIVKESRSFSGWNLKDWFKGNWTTLKEVIKVGIPFFLGWFATGNEPLTLLITAVGKLILDTGEYYFKQYTE